MGSEEKYWASASLCQRLKRGLLTLSSDHDIAAYDAHTSNAAHGKVHCVASGCSFCNANMYRCKYVPFYGSVVLQMYILCMLFVRFLGPMVSVV